MDQVASQRSGRPPSLELLGIEKYYDGVPALRGASLTIQSPGEIHTLIGQNGCGKSSLLGVLSGQLQADAGQIRMDGKAVRFRNPADAVQHGIAMVSQETALADDLTVMENVLLGRMDRRWGLVNRSAAREHAREVLGRLGLSYDPDRTVRSLRPDQRQMVEIARAISLDAKLLILDEPTSALTEDEVAELFAALRTLVQRGVSVLFVSHRLAEVFEISTDITVMRDGRTVGTGPIDTYTPKLLVQQMVGGVDLRGAPVTSAGGGGTDAGPVLQLDGLTCPGAFADVDLEVRSGRITGIAGLDGSGRNEVLEAIFGVRAPSAGTISLHGTDARNATPRRSIAAGVGYVPPERKTQGLVLDMPVASNLGMVASHAVARTRLIPRRRERATASKVASTVRLAGPVTMPARALSGGNQQKVVLGKWLAAEPTVLLLDDPTRGVDVAAKAEIHTQLRLAAANGLALLVTSSEIPELIDLCDEVLVMYRGRITHRFDKADFSESAIATVAAGGQL